MIKDACKQGLHDGQEAEPTGLVLAWLSPFPLLIQPGALGHGMVLLRFRADLSISINPLRKSPSHAFTHSHTPKGVPHQYPRDPS